MNKLAILIIGGLGYVGTKLCELYKDSKLDITVIDNRFLPSSVEYLKNNNIK